MWTSLNEKRSKAIKTKKRLFSPKKSKFSFPFLSDVRELLLLQGAVFVCPPE